MHLFKVGLLLKFLFILGQTKHKLTSWEGGDPD